MNLFQFSLQEADKEEKKSWVESKIGLTVKNSCKKKTRPIH